MSLPSVETPVICGLESYAGLHHLVSVVTGQLRDDRDALDLVAASFPGGSITGAPKLRAMEIIAELERRPRGIYCGAIGMIGFDGAIDLSIAIRTIVIEGREMELQVGGGHHDPVRSRPRIRGDAHQGASSVRRLRANARRDGRMILVIDNYDSFVHNVARHFEVLGTATIVLRNDAVSLATIDTMRPEAIVLSPGPCTPDEAGLSNGGDPGLLGRYSHSRGLSRASMYRRRLRRSHRARATADAWSCVKPRASRRPSVRRAADAVCGRPATIP